MTLLLTRADALKHLTGTYGIDQACAVRALAVADQYGVNAESTGNGPVTIRAMHNGKEQYQLEDGIPVEAVGKVRAAGYNQTKSETPTDKSKGRNTMPRGTKAATTETAESNGEVDYTIYATKDVTATMEDFAAWLNQEVGDLNKMDAVRIVSLAGTLRMEFQRSDFNVERRETRRTEREADAEQAKAAREAAKAEKASKEPSEPAATKPATRGRAAGGTTGKRGAAAAPARGRGRGKPATAAAPF
jgi:hypothetical protein